MEVNISNQNRTENLKIEVNRLKKEIKDACILCITFHITLLTMFYFGGESFNQWSVVGFALVSTILIISSIVSICTSIYKIFTLKRKIASLQKKKIDTTNEFNKNGTGTASAAVYVNKRSKSDGNKVDEESKRRVFNQNSNVIINSSQHTKTESRKQGNVEMKNKKIKSNDETSNTTQVALGVALSVATTTSAFQNDITTSLGCGSSGDGGGDCGGF
ncbi:hypothetical protein F8158_27965 [Bacillus cereus]|uniref:Transmembrane protein n=1 Tax=Bacillus cereus TaxID=1396 RepID=A0AB34D1Y7_BACCE|nr:hypothetical protein [Bacillus cereus]KAB2491140.1 hypothetical protein F8158_27965 [Bacillus cereus]